MSRKRGAVRPSSKTGANSFKLQSSERDHSSSALAQRTTTPRPSQKVQVATHFRPASTGSVPFLSFVCPNAQLFSPRLRVNFEWRRKNETVQTLVYSESLPVAGSKGAPCAPPDGNCSRIAPVPIRPERRPLAGSNGRSVAIAGSAACPPHRSQVAARTPRIARDESPNPNHKSRGL
jgi:hypothetical protein